MSITRSILASLCLAWMACATPAGAAEFPAPKEGMFVAKDFKFHDGSTHAELKLAYRTVGDPSGEPVLVLHGTGGSGQSMLTPGFGGEMFGPGQPFDATKFFIILPDALGAGKSGKPSDGLKAEFPQYNYDDSVDAQYRLVTEGLGIKHLRAIIGNSMGGMHAWVWATRYPDMMDGVIPMASQPTAMSSRNWMMRRLMIETIKADPDYKGGNYTSPPKFAAIANVVYSTGTNGGDQSLQRQAPTREAADKIVEARLKAPFTADTNDFIYQWASSADYDPSAKLGAIKARVLVINSDDDERNPVATGLLDEAMKKVADGRIFIIPGSPTTGGHGTTGGMAKLYAAEVAKFMADLPKR